MSDQRIRRTHDVPTDLEHLAARPDPANSPNPHLSGGIGWMLQMRPHRS